MVSLAAARSADRVPEEALSQLLGEYMGSVPSDLSALQGYEQLQQLLQRPDLRVRGRQGGASDTMHLEELLGDAPRGGYLQCAQGAVMGLTTEGCLLRPVCSVPQYIFPCSYLTMQHALPACLPFPCRLLSALQRAAGWTRHSPI